MNIVSRFTYKNLKRNRRRTIVTIIAVILSSALLTAVLGMISTFYHSMEMYYIKSIGSFHSQFLEVPVQDIDLISQNAHVKKTAIMSIQGFAKLEGCNDKDKPYIRVAAFNDNAFEDVSVCLKEGRLPENENEILIPEHMYQLSGVRCNIGDQLSVDLGERVFNGKIVEDSRDYIDMYSIENANEEVPKEESLSVKEHRIYTVVGITERPSLNVESFGYPGFTCITRMNDPEYNYNGRINVFVQYDIPKNTGDYQDKIVETLRKENKDYTYFPVKNELVRLYGSLSDNIMSAFYLLGTLVLFILIGTSIYVIKNSFSISVAEKKRQYGMLASIGATGKQIRNTVLLEGLFIAVVGIAGGIMLGTVVVIILSLISDHLMGSGYIRIVFSMPVWIFLISIALSAVTIYLSAIIPARKAEKLSPIEAIRGNTEVKLNNKSLKINPLVGKLFGIGGIISAKNLKRSKRQYRTTVVSLTIAIALLICLSTFLDQSNGLARESFEDYGYNFSVQIHYDSKDIDGDALFDQISSLEGVKEAYTYKNFLGYVDADIYGSEQCNKRRKEEYGERYDKETGINILEMRPDQFEIYAKSLGIKADDYSDVVILEDDITDSGSRGEKVFFNIFSVQENDVMTIKFLEDKSVSKDVRITKKSTKRPVGFSSTYFYGGLLVVSEGYFDDIEAERYNSGMYFVAEDATMLEKEVVKILSSNQEYHNVSYRNIEREWRNSSKALLLINIFLYGFVTVIMLIGVTNVFNTITTNMNLRSREFAMLQSVGMTKKEFDKMIRLESIMYGLKSLCYGVILGMILSRLIYMSVLRGFDFGYRLPVKALVVCAALVTVIVGFTMKYSVDKINKQNIIETIRNQTY